MGYRSEVAMLVYGPPEKVAAFDLWVTIKGKDKYKDFVLDGQELFTKHILDEKCHGRQYTQNEIKWYDDGEAFQNEIADIAEEAGLCYEFVRIGEESGDIETNYLGDGVQYYLGSCSYISGIM